MVNRHFSLHQFPDWRPEFTRVQNLFALMHIAFARQTGDSEWTGIFVLNTGNSMEPGASAYCYPGGVETNVLPFAQRTDRIYLCRPLAKDSVQYQTMALVPELSRYVGAIRIRPTRFAMSRAAGWILPG